jgi:hypothetical protein
MGDGAIFRLSTRSGGDHARRLETGNMKGPKVMSCDLAASRQSSFT